MPTLMIDDCKSIDDFIDIKAGDAVARTYDKGIEYLMSQEWDLLLLDHDLGCLNNKGNCPPPHKPCFNWREDCEQKNGMDIMNWIRENPQHRPKKIRCISWNPIGKKNIEAAIEELENLK